LLYDRTYRLLIGKKGQSQGIEITDSLRIKFEIEKTAKKNPNKSKIEVYNMRKETRAEVEKPNTRVVLYAGYKDDAGALLIFQGDVSYAWSKKDGADIITEFELGDGATEIRDTTISVGYSKGVKSTQVLNDVSKKMGLPLTLPSNAPSRVWNNGLSFHGPARTLLDKVTKGTGLEWSIQNGNLQVIEHGMVTTRQGILITQDSGMIGSPERERLAKAHTHKQSKTPGGETGQAQIEPDYDGWRVKSLLMPMLNPGDRIRLEGQFVTGVYRIEQVKHEGDSDASGNWQSDLRVVDPRKPLDAKKSKGGVANRTTEVDVAEEDAGFV
jgi:hypothetical protein